MISRVLNYYQLVEKTLKIREGREKKSYFQRIIVSREEGVEFPLNIDNLLSQTCDLSD